MGGPALTVASGPPFLLDTHAWIWYAAGSERLPRSLRGAIDEAGPQIWLSPISIWELGLLIERGRVEVTSSLRSWVEVVMSRIPTHEAPVTAEVAARSHGLHLGHRDPADHLLAATALTYDLTLVTLDERLTSVPWLPTRSA